MAKNTQSTLGGAVKTSYGKKSKTRVIKPKKKGQKPIKFKEGGLKQSLGVSSKVPIPKGKFQKALKGGYGKKAKAQANFKRNVLVGKKKKKTK